MMNKIPVLIFEKRQLNRTGFPATIENNILINLKEIRGNEQQSLKGGSVVRLKRTFCGDQRMIGKIKYTPSIPVLKVFADFFLKRPYWETVLNWELTRF